MDQDGRTSLEGAYKTQPRLLVPPGAGGVDIRIIAESISRRVNKANPLSTGIRSLSLAKRGKKIRQRVARFGLIAANLAFLGMVAVLVSYDPKTSAGSAGLLSSMTAETATARANPLDKLSAADIAVNVALMVGSDKAVAVINQADSVNAQLAVKSFDEPVVVRPQVVSTDLKSQGDIVTYTVREGDTLAAVAEAHGVTSDSIRWSNNLRRDVLVPGQTLLIPPVNGIVYKVRPGDTVDSLAARFSADRTQLIADNDAEISGLRVGEHILIRDGVQPAPPVLAHRFNHAFHAAFGGNGYIYGYCTWHAANRRIQIGRPLPTNLGNAITWFHNAQRAGLAVGTQPQAGAVLWHVNFGGLGHVAFVERVNEDGSLLVSDMNYPLWGRVTYRTVTPSEFGAYRFIY